MRKLISLILPAYNEQNNISDLYYEVTETTEKLGEYDFEYIFVDNCSTDNTREEMLKICAKDDRWKYIKLSRNFTAEMSITAGFRVASGDAAILLFTDLQDPPSLIPRFLKKWEEGYDVVCGFMEDRKSEGMLKHFGAKVAFSLLSKLSNINLPENVVDCRLMSREAVEAFNHINEKNRYFRGIASWIGYKTAVIQYQRRARKTGMSKANILYLFDYVLKAITSFSIKPLRFFLYFGFVVLLFTIAYAIFVIITFMLNLTVTGLSTIVILLLMILSILSIGIGILGEYIGRIYIESKQRPLWIIEEAVNIEINEKQKFGQ